MQLLCTALLLLGGAAALTVRAPRAALPPAAAAVAAGPPSSSSSSSSRALNDPAAPAGAGSLNVTSCSLDSCNVTSVVWNDPSDHSKGNVTRTEPCDRAEVCVHCSYAQRQHRADEARLHPEEAPPVGFDCPLPACVKGTQVHKDRRLNAGGGAVAEGPPCPPFTTAVPPSVIWAIFVALGFVNLAAIFIVWYRKELMNKVSARAARMRADARGARCVPSLSTSSLIFPPPSLTFVPPPRAQPKSAAEAKMQAQALQDKADAAADAKSGTPGGAAAARAYAEAEAARKAAIVQRGLERKAAAAQRRKSEFGEVVTTTPSPTTTARAAMWGEDADVAARLTEAPPPPPPLPPAGGFQPRAGHRRSASVGEGAAASSGGGFDSTAAASSAGSQGQSSSFVHGSLLDSGLGGAGAAAVGSQGSDAAARYLGGAEGGSGGGGAAAAPAAAVAVSPPEFHGLGAQPLSASSSDHGSVLSGGASAAAPPLAPRTRRDVVSRLQHGSAGASQGKS